MSSDHFLSLKNRVSDGLSYVDEKALSLVGQERYYLIKDKATHGASYVNEKTLFLIDGIIKLLDVKVLLALICLAVISFVAADAWVDQTPLNIKFTPEQVSYLQLFETRVQSTFYSLFCISIFGFFLAAGLFFPDRFRKGQIQGWQVSSVIPDWLRPWVGVIFWTAVFIAYKQTGYNMLQTGLKLRDFLLAFAVAYLMKETIHGRFRTRTIAVAFVAMVAIFFLLPFALPYEVPNMRLFSMDMHWSAVIGDGLYKSTFAGSEFDAFSNYGVFLNMLVAGARSIPLFESFGGTITLLKLTNFIFFGLVVVIIFQRLGVDNKRMVWATALLILFIYSSRISGFAETFAAPNQLPIRILIVPPVVILAYFLAGRSGLVAPMLCGLISPALVFYNFETSFYCILAMGFAIFIESARKGILSVLVSGGLFALAFVASGIFLMLALFEGSIPSIFAKLVELTEIKIHSGTSGFAGLPVYFFLPFLWIMVHTFVLFSRYLLSVREDGPLSAIEFQNVVIVGMIIAVGPYVMNRFSLQNMLVPFLLYTLLVLPKLTSGPRSDRVLWSFMLIVLITPFIFGNPVKRVWSGEFVSGVSDVVQGRLQPCLDGMTASDELCDYTLEKAEELTQLIHENPGLRWISDLSLTMTRLTGTQPALDQKVPFFYGHTQEKRDNLVVALDQLQAPVLVFDYNLRPRGNRGVHPTNYPGIHSTAEDFQRSLVHSAGYRIIGKTKYWVIARKRYR